MADQPVSPSAPIPTSTADQIQDLIDRSMTVPDIDFAVRCLTHIGYHRLASYWRPFQIGNVPSSPFRQGASFGLVMARYMFDQRLRSLLLEALSYIEISVRNQWSHHLVLHSSRGEFAHLEAGLFDAKFYGANLQELERNYNQIRGRDGRNFQSVSIWDVAPTMSFGNLSKWYASLADRTIRQSISGNYGLDDATFRSVLRHLTSIRNTCAHHERIWNLTIKPGLRIPRELSGSREMTDAFNADAKGKVYNALVMIVHLVETITPNGDWPERLLALKNASPYASIPETNMGFPIGWTESPVWKRHLQNEDSTSTPA